MTYHLKLHYFNRRGRAELPRFILAFAKVDYEDYRIEPCDWPKVKETYPNHQVPVLEITKDGNRYMLSQSLTIARHLAKRNGLAGVDMIDEARCDEVADCLAEIHNFGALIINEADPARKEKYIERMKTVEMPRIFGRIEKQLLLNGGEHVVGEQWTWADFYISTLLGGMIKRLGPECEKLVREEYPTMFAVHKNVEAIPEIAAYIEKRPVTEF